MQSSWKKHSNDGQTIAFWQCGSCSSVLYRWTDGLDCHSKIFAHIVAHRKITDMFTAKICLLLKHWIFAARCYVSAAVLSCGFCPSIRCPSCSCIVKQRVNTKLSSNFFSPSGSHAVPYGNRRGSLNGGVESRCRRRFWHATLRLRSAIHRHHPPQRAVLSQICCFRERKVVLFQILLDGGEPRDAGTTWLSSPVCRRGG